MNLLNFRRWSLYWNPRAPVAEQPFFPHRLFERGRIPLRSGDLVFTFLGPLALARWPKQKEASA